MCDLTDPRILETYTSIVEDEPTNWLILGYNDTRDVISLYSKGVEGLSEFRNHLSDEVLYGFVRVDDRFILVTWVSEQVSGVRRARALVHSRSVASLLKLHHAQLTASSLNDLSDANIRTRLKLGDSQEPGRRSSSISQKRASRRQSVQSPVGPTSPTSPTSPVPQQAQYDEFVEASETLPPTVVDEPAPIVDQEEQLRQQQEQERQRQEQGALRQRKLQEEQEKLAAAKAAAEAAAVAKAAAAAAKATAAAKAVAEEKKAAQQKRLEEEKELRRQEEAQREQKEKRLLQQRLLEAEKNKDVVLSGYVSVQPQTSPFWRRRYFTIKGKMLAFYRDELQSTPITVLDLNNVKRLNGVNVDIETFVPNAFVLETAQNGSYQLFADDKKDLQTILTALQTVI